MYKWSLIANEYQNCQMILLHFKGNFAFLLSDTFIFFTPKLPMLPIDFQLMTFPYVSLRRERQLAWRMPRQSGDLIHLSTAKYIHLQTLVPRHSFLQLQSIDFLYCYLFLPSSGIIYPIFSQPFRCLLRYYILSALLISHSQLILWGSQILFNIFTASLDDSSLKILIL